MTPTHDPAAAPLPLETLFDGSTGGALPLPPDLADFYGSLRFPPNQDRPYVIANLVTSLDGVVSLGVEGKSGGKEISGSNAQDRALMGVLRAAADAVVVGAGTLRDGKGSPLTAASVFPPLANAYSSFRDALSKAESPLAVIVTASGDLDPSMPIFNRGQEVLIITTRKGARHLRDLGLPSHVKLSEVQAEEAGDENTIPAAAILDAIAAVRPSTLLLVEGGPHLLGDFLSAHLIDEQFLTLSPQLVGGTDATHELHLVEGHSFAPSNPLWSTLNVVKRCESLLFLRYTFTSRPTH